MSEMAKMTLNFLEISEHFNVVKSILTYNRLYLIGLDADDNIINTIDNAIAFIDKIGH